MVIDKWHMIQVYFIILVAYDGYSNVVDEQVNFSLT